MTEHMMTIRRAATILGISHTAAYNALNAGELRPEQWFESASGRKIAVFSRAELRRYAKAHGMELARRAAGRAAHYAKVAEEI